MTTADQAAPTGLRFSEELRAATWVDHEKAEHGPYMQALIGGSLPRESYIAMVTQLYFVYEVLEEAAGTLDDADAKPFLFPELHRIPALEADLAFLLGPEWRDLIAPDAATRQYVERLREVCFTWAGGYIAHQYTRYLGDLSGGQIIGRIASRTYGLSPEAGGSFYNFGEIEKLKVFKDDYRTLLDDTPWDADEQRRVIDEVLLAYRLNTQLLAELDSNLTR